MEEFIEDLLFPMKKRIGKGGDKLQDDGKGILRVFSFLSFFFFFGVWWIYNCVLVLGVPD